MGLLTDKINELDHLEEQYRRQRESIEMAIAEILHCIGQNPAIEPIKEHIFLIPMSELRNSPWSPEFHDWTIQAERLLAILNKRPTREWLTFIQSLRRKKTHIGWSSITVDKQVLSMAFIRRVTEKL